MNQRIIGPNTTQVPNIIFDYWMQKMTPAEFKVILCICRKTFGWHKARDRISLRQIEKMTGLGKKSIVSSIEKLIEMQLVKKYRRKDEFDGSDAPNEYEINVFAPIQTDTATDPDGSMDPDMEKNLGNDVSLRGGGSILKTHPPVSSGYTPPVSSGYTQKKDITKERPTKEIPPNPLKGEAAIAAHACEDFSSSPSSTSSKPPGKKKKKSREQKLPAKVGPPKIAYLENIKLTEEQYAELLAEYGKEKLHVMMTMLSNWKNANEKEVPHDYYKLVPLEWVNKKYEKEKKEAQGGQYVGKSNRMQDIRDKQYQEWKDVNGNPDDNPNVLRFD